LNQAHFFCRIRVPFWAGFVTIAFAAVLLFCAWVLLDPAWHPGPPKPDMNSKATAGYFMVLFFASLPVWIRVPFLLFTTTEMLRRAARRLFHTFDDKPDFVISPEGIAGWSGMSFCSIPWPEVSTAFVYERAIHIYGTGKGARRFFGILPPRRPHITYSQLFFPRKNTDIILAIRSYRPDLMKAEALKISG
jgi:hypothetical protein